VKKIKKTSDELLLEISEKLDKMIGILSMQEIQDIDEKIRMLKSLSFSSDQIGPFVGMKGTSVRDRKGWKNT